MGEKRMDIGKRILLVRQSKGLVRSDFGEIASKIEHIETGRVVPKFNQLLDICEFLDIEIWDLTAETLTIEFKE